MGEAVRRAVRAVPYPEDPAMIARLLRAERAWFWLDGAAPGARGGGVPPEPRISYLGAAEHVVEAVPGGEREFLAMLAMSPDPGVGVGAGVGAGAGGVAEPGRGFSSGWITALSYEFGSAVLGLEPAPDAAAAAFALRVGTVLAIDHDRRTAELRGGSEAELDAWLARFGPGALDERSTGDDAEPAAPEWRLDGDAYRAGVEACRSAIGEGDAYVLCLTDTARVDAPEGIDPLDLYTRMRAGGGAIRGGVIVAGTRALVSASPERFIEMRGERIATRPIKGTRRRDPDPGRDARLAAELAADPKERAENLMIVDLMRNDLSRVCEPGSVAVDGFLHVESHSHVHQLVSTVRGRLRPGSTVADALLATFPGGSMTGAPKRRTVELLAGIEAGPRGLYSGCFGWIDEGGDAELAMTIRSVELRDAVGGDGVTAPRFRTALVGAGGGITADSDPRSEFNEKELKAAPLLAALRPGPGAVS